MRLPTLSACACGSRAVEEEVVNRVGHKWRLRCPQCGRHTGYYLLRLACYEKWNAMCNPWRTKK